MFLDIYLEIETQKLVWGIIIAGIALAFLGMLFFLNRDSVAGFIPTTIGAVAIIGGCAYLYLSSNHEPA